MSRTDYTEILHHVGVLDVVENTTLHPNFRYDVKLLPGWRMTRGSFIDQKWGYFNSYPDFLEAFPVLIDGYGNGDRG